MSRGVLSGSLILGSILALVLYGASALAVQPVTVQVEAAVELDDTSRATGRNRAFRAALIEAVLEVARTQLRRPLVEEEEAALREALGSGAATAVVTYRIEPGSGPRPRAGDALREEYALGLTATVDADQVRAQLAAIGWLAPQSERPSVVLLARLEGRDDPDHPFAPGLLETFQSLLEQRLAGEGFIVVEPALRASPASQAEGALALARAVGADIAVDVGVKWRPRSDGSRSLGGSVRVRLRAFRTQDAFELAASRFDAPAYHARPAEAQARALEAVGSQVAENLVLQLNRNWSALSREAGPVRLVLNEVSGLAQVEGVRDALLGSLAARDGALLRLGPRSATLRVRALFSPGALQDRLASLLAPLRGVPARAPSGESGSGGDARDLRRDRSGGARLGPMTRRSRMRRLRPAARAERPGACSRCSGRRAARRKGAGGASRSGHLPPKLIWNSLA
jgi:hypothetical protein